MWTLIVKFSQMNGHNSLCSHEKGWICKNWGALCTGNLVKSWKALYKSNYFILFFKLLVLLLLLFFNYYILIIIICIYYFKSIVAVILTFFALC